MDIKFICFETHISHVLAKQQKVLNPFKYADGSPSSWFLKQPVMSSEHKLWQFRSTSWASFNICEHQLSNLYLNENREAVVLNHETIPWNCLNITDSLSGRQTYVAWTVLSRTRRLTWKLKRQFKTKQLNQGLEPIYRSLLTYMIEQIAH